MSGSTSPSTDPRSTPSQFAASQFTASRFTASRFTARLRLEPLGPARARDLWLVHDDDEVWPWYGDEKPTLEQAERQARSMDESWRLHGVHKWIAYDRVSGEVVGRGGLSRTPVDDDWGQIYEFLPAEPWVRAAHEARRPFIAHANWLEIGWALRREYWGRGYASEIGHAGLAFAFDVLGARAVVSCTVRHNARSRAVMERIGMRYAGEIRSRGMVEGVEGERDDAPYAVCVLLRRDWERRKRHHPLRVRGFGIFGEMHEVIAAKPYALSD